MISLCSINAMEEFLKLAPHVIDRSADFREHFKVMYKSQHWERSNSNWEMRRRYVMGKINLGEVSKKIPLILKSLDERLSTVKPGDRIELSGVLEEASMLVITKTIFGEDADD